MLQSITSIVGLLPIDCHIKIGAVIISDCSFSFPTFDGRIYVFVYWSL